MASEDSLVGPVGYPCHNIKCESKLVLLMRLLAQAAQCQINPRSDHLTFALCLMPLTKPLPVPKAKALPPTPKIGPPPPIPPKSSAPSPLPARLPPVVDLTEDTYTEDSDFYTEDSYDSSETPPGKTCQEQFEYQVKQCKEIIGPIIG